MYCCRCNVIIYYLIKIKVMFESISTGNSYPKTLVIRNTVGGGIWQVYHVDNAYQALYISKGAMTKGYEGRTLEDYQPDLDDTFPNWRMELARGFVDMLPSHLSIKEGALNVPVTEED